MTQVMNTYLRQTSLFQNAPKLRQHYPMIQVPAMLIRKDKIIFFPGRTSTPTNTSYILLLLFQTINDYLRQAHFSRTTNRFSLIFYKTHSIYTCNRSTNAHRTANKINITPAQTSQLTMSRTSRYRQKNKEPEPMPTCSSN